MRHGDERGLAASVEAAVILPALVLFIGLLLTLARVAIADQQVGAAAGAGARAASLERTAVAADAAARQAVRAALDERGVTCSDLAVSVDASAVSRAVGARGSVLVSVACEVPLADVTVPFVPGSVGVSGERGSPVDPLRGR